MDNTIGHVKFNVVTGGFQNEYIVRVNLHYQGIQPEKDGLFYHKPKVGVLLIYPNITVWAKIPANLQPSSGDPSANPARSSCKLIVFQRETAWLTERSYKLR
jgi:hypothetical protein